ncbi:MAG: glycosyltransferase, partial [Clostridia bacterium]|nr:glycosyltransferase [Clostridia bacterium]
MMNTEKKVAVLLSSYNGEKYIAEQIDSILAQTYPNIDIYVRDDCSTDGTVAVLRPYAERGDIILMEGEKNLGYPEGFYEMLRT